MNGFILSLQINKASCYISHIHCNLNGFVVNKLMQTILSSMKKIMIVLHCIFFFLFNPYVKTTLTTLASFILILKLNLLSSYAHPHLHVPWVWGHSTWPSDGTRQQWSLLHALWDRVVLSQVNVSVLWLGFDRMQIVLSSSHEWTISTSFVFHRFWFFRHVGSDGLIEGVTMCSLYYPRIVWFPRAESCCCGVCWKLLRGR